MINVIWPLKVEIALKMYPRAYSVGLLQMQVTETNLQLAESNVFNYTHTHTHTHTHTGKNKKAKQEIEHQRLGRLEMELVPGQMKPFSSLSINL